MDENFKTYIKPFIEYEKLKVWGEEGKSKIMFDQYIKWVYYSWRENVMTELFLVHY